MKKNKILGWVLTVWGALVLLSGSGKIFSGEVGSGAYGAGMLVGFAFGGIMLFVGIRSLRQQQK